MWSVVILHKQTFYINRLAEASLLGNVYAMKWIAETTKDGHISFSFHDNIIKKGGGFEEF